MSTLAPKRCIGVEPQDATALKGLQEFLKSADSIGQLPCTLPVHSLEAVNHGGLVFFGGPDQFFGSGRTSSSGTTTFTGDWSSLADQPSFGINPSSGSKVLATMPNIVPRLANTQHWLAAVPRSSLSKLSGKSHRSPNSSSLSKLSGGVSYPGCQYAAELADVGATPTCGETEC